MNKPVPLALDPEHLDYIVALLQRRCVWIEANPILLSIMQQVQKPQLEAHPQPPNGSAELQEPLQ